MKFKKITCSILCISLLNIINPISNSVQASTNLPIPISTQTETEKAFDMIPMSRQTFIGVSGSSRMDYMHSANAISWGVRLNVGLASFVGTISVRGTGTSYFADTFTVSGASDVLYLPYLPSGSYSAQITGIAVGLDGNKYTTVPNAIIYFYR